MCCRTSRVHGSATTSTAWSRKARSSRSRFMPRTSFPIDQLLTILTETPRRIAEVTVGVPETVLQAASAGNWSANEVLAHLRSCADVWGRNMARILTEDTPTWKAVNPRKWIESTDYASLPFRSSLRAFDAQRTALLAA